MWTRYIFATFSILRVIQTLSLDQVRGMPILYVATATTFGGVLIEQYNDTRQLIEDDMIYRAITSIISPTGIDDDAIIELNEVLTDLVSEGESDRVSGLLELLEQAADYDERIYSAVKSAIENANIASITRDTYETLCYSSQLASVTDSDAFATGMGNINGMHIEEAFNNRIAFKWHGPKS